MITVSFLSGDLVQFDKPFEGSTIYNLKRVICDWIEETQGKEVDISLVYLYRYINDTDTNEEVKNDQILNNGDLYKIFVNEYERRILYLKDGIIRYHREKVERNENDVIISGEMYPNLCNEHNILYYFDRDSFTSSWKYKEDSFLHFFKRNGYTLRDENDYNTLYPSEDEWESDEDENEWDDDRIEDRTRECLSSVFKKLKIKWWI